MTLKSSSRKISILHISYDSTLTWASAPEETSTLRSLENATPDTLFNDQVWYQPAWIKEMMNFPWFCFRKAWVHIRRNTYLSWTDIIYQNFGIISPYSEYVVILRVESNTCCCGWLHDRQHCLLSLRMFSKFLHACKQPKTHEQIQKIWNHVTCKR